VKKLICLAATASLLTAAAFAQDAKTTPMSARDNVVKAGTAPVLKNPVFNGVSTPKVPSYCKPCLFYGGDINPNDPNANGLSSEKDLAVSQSEVLNAFIVPSGHSWTVTGVFGNTLSTVGVIDPAQADWSIRTGVSSGNGGTIVASGTNAATYNPTGRNAFGLNEYTVFVDLTASPVSLSSGTHFLEVVPYCTNSNDSNCGAARYFESDTTQGTNRQGRSIKDDSFFNSSYFGADYEETGGPSGACGGIGCDYFSTGVRGTGQ
jgi:hypothetical protein